RQRARRTWPAPATCSYKYRSVLGEPEILERHSRLLASSTLEQDQLDRGHNARDLNRCVRLAVPVSTPHVLAATELLDDDLLVAELVDDRGNDPRSLDNGSADRRTAGPRDEQHL